MAKVIIEGDETNPVFEPYSIWRICLVGAALGAIFWFLTAIIIQVIESVSVAGDVAAILTATLGVVVMLRLRMAQPLIIALATCLSLWGLAGWTSGLAVFEVIAFSVLLYCLCYVLFSWIARYSQVVPVLSVIALVIIATRIVISL